MHCTLTFPVGGCRRIAHLLFQWEVTGALHTHCSIGRLQVHCTLTFPVGGCRRIAHSLFQWEVTGALHTHFSSGRLQVHCTLTVSMGGYRLTAHSHFAPGRGSAAARWLGLRVRIPPETWMSASWESYQVWCVCV